mmetsp:Transcript_46180/g.70638  ORF Transcript_46180/g.70638 Transcript_46180/m.70638 type:complete len:80 (+) Transcript_46180:838-1077(+)
MDWCHRYTHATVKDFLLTLFDEPKLPNNVPSWVEECPFCVEGAFSRSTFVATEMNNASILSNKPFPFLNFATFCCRRPR